MVARAFFDEIRTLGFAGISGAYAAVGTPLTVQARGICFTKLAGLTICQTNRRLLHRIFDLAIGSFYPTPEPILVLSLTFT